MKPIKKPTTPPRMRRPPSPPPSNDDDVGGGAGGGGSNNAGAPGGGGNTPGRTVRTSAAMDRFYGGHRSNVPAGGGGGGGGGGAPASTGAGSAGARTPPPPNSKKMTVNTPLTSNVAGSSDPAMMTTSSGPHLDQSPQPPDQQQQLAPTVSNVSSMEEEKESPAPPPRRQSSRRSTGSNASASAARMKNAARERAMRRSRRSSRRSLMSPAAAAAAVTAASGTTGAGAPVVAPPAVGGEGERSSPRRSRGTKGGLDDDGGDAKEVEEGGWGPSLICSLCYRGIEVIFATSTQTTRVPRDPVLASSSSSGGDDGDGAGIISYDTVRQDSILVVHARTRTPAFLALDDHDHDHGRNGGACAGRLYVPPGEEIVAIRGNPVTGKVVVATHTGSVHTFVPIPCSVRRYPFGAYAWEAGVSLDVRDVFVAGGGGGSGGGPSPRKSSMSSSVATSSAGGGGDDDALSRCAAPSLFRRTRPGDSDGSAFSSSKNGGADDDGEGEEFGPSAPPMPVHLSISRDDKLLVAFRDQLAVFDASGPSPSSSSSSSDDDDDEDDEGDISSGNRSSSPFPHGGGNKRSSVGDNTDVVLMGDNSAAAADAAILWTARLPGGGLVLSADMSGDGRAIACVVTGDGAGEVPATSPSSSAASASASGEARGYGVRTYLRDSEDGSNSNAVNAAMLYRSTPNGNSNNRHRSSVPSIVEVNTDEENSPEPSPSSRKRVGGSGGGAGVNGAAVASPPPPVTTTSFRSSSATSGRSAGVAGILYKPGRFLPHSAPVTRLSWRGRGNNTSTNTAPSHLVSDEEDNDLLLTHCASDSSFRVFSQALPAVRQILHWVAPPYSLAAWVEGVSLCNLGDLTDVRTGQITNEDIAMGGSESRGVGGGGATGMVGTTFGSGVVSPGGGSSGIVGGVYTGGGGYVHGYGSAAGGTAGVPSSAAGAWICEVTFRGTFPAVRLSRLSYMRSGGEEQSPAHFESVAAVLPPGCLPGAPLGPADGVHGYDVDGGSDPAAAAAAAEVAAAMASDPADYLQLSVQGVWPSWNAASANLGGSSSSSSGGGGGGAGVGQDRGLGGSHAPPSELRLVASHGVFGTNRLVVLQFPLWGEKDLGANLEFGTPLRYTLSLRNEFDYSPFLAIGGGGGRHDDGDGQDGGDGRQRKHRGGGGGSAPTAVLNFAGSTLVAEVQPDGRGIGLTWRAEGSGSILPRGSARTTTSTTRAASTPTASRPGKLSNVVSSSSSSLASMGSSSGDDDVNLLEGVATFPGDGMSPDEAVPERYVDVSVSPLPLVLPPLRAPHVGAATNDGMVGGAAAATASAAAKAKGTLAGGGGGGGGKFRLRQVHWWPSDASHADDSWLPQRLLALTSPGWSGSSQRRSASSPSVVLYELPPPHTALEPSMPFYDPNNAMSGSASAVSDVRPGLSSSQHGGSVGGGAVVGEVVSTSGSQQQPPPTSALSRSDYEVILSPHPDFGIGLRLESHPTDLRHPAIAGSFKKHPLSGRRLPAEKSGMVVLGDCLVAVNGIPLEDMVFDDIINVVRRVGSRAVTSREPLKLRFRPRENHQANVSAAAAGPGGESAYAANMIGQEVTIPTAPSPGTTPTPSPKGGEGGVGGRRTVSQILGVRPQHRRAGSQASSAAAALDTSDLVSEGDDSDDDAVTVQVGADSETQQEFGRVVGLVRLPFGDDGPGVGADRSTTKAAALEPCECSLLLPWPSRGDENIGLDDGAATGAEQSGETGARGDIGAGAGEAVEDECALLLTVRDGTTVVAHLIAARSRYGEAALALDPGENICCTLIGSSGVDLDDDKKEENTYVAPASGAAIITSLTAVDTVRLDAATGSTSLSVAACDSSGGLTLLSIDLAKEKEGQPPSERLSLRQQPLSRRRSKTTKTTRTELEVRSSSWDMLASFDRGCPDGVVTVWSACPRVDNPHDDDVSSKGGEDGKSEDVYRGEYYTSSRLTAGDVVLDVQWIPSGTLNVLPLVAVFTPSRAVVYSCRRRMSSNPAIGAVAPWLANVAAQTTLGGISDWKAVAELDYSKLTAHGAVGGMSGRGRPAWGLDVVSVSPKNLFPHLLPALIKITSPSPSTFTEATLYTASKIRCDWHPDAILAALMSEDRGVHYALFKKGKKNTFRKRSRKEKIKSDHHMYVPRVLEWLSQWLNPVETERPRYSPSPETTGGGSGDDDAASIVTLAKMRDLDKNNVSISAEDEDVSMATNEKDDDDDESEGPSSDEEDSDVEEVQDAARLMASLASTAKNKPNSMTAGGALETEEPDSQTDVLMFELQDALRVALVEICASVSESGGSGPPLSSQQRTTPTANPVTPDTSKPLIPAGTGPQMLLLPKPLRCLNPTQLCFLLAIVRLVRKPSNYKKLDPQSQLALFAMDLTEHIMSAGSSNAEDKGADSTEKNALGTRGNFGAEMPSPALGGARPAMKKSESFCVFSGGTSSGDMSRRSIASGAALAALTSDSQHLLLSRCRSLREKTDQATMSGSNKLDWVTARRFLIPFWLRSPSELRSVSEEIAQALFKSTRDIMECSLLYIAMRKIPKMLALARTDDSISGKKFFKFVSDHDFASLKGRKAAEKNAYSLLRKRRYGVASAFFLLAEPPMVKTALEVIVSQMKDLPLAFLVARLLDSNAATTTGPSDPGLTIGGGGGLGTLGGFGLGGGGMGGFSGFSSGGAGTDSAPPEESFKEWKPSPSLETRNMLKARGLVIAKEQGDSNLEAIFNLWLGMPGKAALSLVSLDTNRDTYADTIGIVQPSFDDASSYSSPSEEMQLSNLPSTPQSNANATSASPSSSAFSFVMDQTIQCSNAQINFSSRPLVLRAMNAPRQIRWCGTLQVAGVYSKRGMELPCLHHLLSGLATCEGKEDVDGSNALVKGREGVFGNGTSQHQHPQREEGGGIQMNPPATTSIFDDFDPPKPKVNPTPASNSGGDMGSSIFDAFDAPSPKPKPSVTKPSSAGGDMGSSIFDAFDAPSPKPKPKPEVSNSSQAATMTSSIFDSFDAPPPKAKPSASGNMSSSIFDAFDGPPPKSKTTVTSASPSGEMNSSIFDDFGGGAPSPAGHGAGIGQGEISSRNNRGTDATSSNASIEAGTLSEEPDPALSLVFVPPLWKDWRDSMLANAAARRLLRELIFVVSLYEGDTTVPPMKLWRRKAYALVPYGATRVLQVHCEPNILTSIENILEELSAECNLGPGQIVEHALNLLAGGGEDCPTICSQHPHRISLEVLLRLVMQRSDLAEEIVLNVSYGQIQQCEGYALANDDFRYQRRTKFHLSSQFQRRYLASVSWQLELCLWLHRGGNLPLSSMAVKLATVAVRVGLLISSWGRSHETVEDILKSEPDCVMDADAGRQLWTSWKIMKSPEDGNGRKKSSAKSSGGWEFLVDCRRAEATEILRNKKPGTFLLRPHPEDHGVFTLSFKTNLVPTTTGADGKSRSRRSSIKDRDRRGSNDSTSSAKGTASAASPKPVSPDDVVQHAIVRLSDAGFRCGSFGPFGSLMKLLEAVSASLPFNLLFDEPPSQGIIQDQGEQPSPNSVLLRKLALHSKTNRYTWRHSKNLALPEEGFAAIEQKGSSNDRTGVDIAMQFENIKDTKKPLGSFVQLLALTEASKQLCAVSAADFEDPREPPNVDDEGQGSISDSASEEDEDVYTVSSRILRPLLEWRRTSEIQIVPELAPNFDGMLPKSASLPVNVAPTEFEIEIAPTEMGSSITGGDSIVRRMIQQGSGVEFRTLRVGDGVNNAIVVLFSRDEAIPWLISSGAEKDEDYAARRLKWMESRRVIEEINLDELSGLANGKGSVPVVDQHAVRYRIVDPWEVEALDTREAELSEATLGRERYVPFSVAAVARSCEMIMRSIGGVHLLSLWSTGKGGIFLTKAIASVLPPWERDAGADLQISSGVVVEPCPYVNSIRQHLYRNLLYRRLRLPQRFLALVQVELLDLKNLTSPGGSSSITAYALLRLKRPGSSTPLIPRAKTLDAASTKPQKIGKSSGPNAPASWGSLVRFRFPLPEDVNCDGVSFDNDRETLFKGPPSELQISAFEKRLITDVSIGSADVKLDALCGGGQLEEWVPLRAGKSGITWFARVRITLRFELMCLENDAEESGNIDGSSTESDRSVSVGLKKIMELSRSGGAHEDAKGVRKSASTPDLLTYLESMVT